MNAEALRILFASARAVCEPEILAAQTLRPAAVLVPLVLREKGICVLLTRRAAHLNHHPGQISFPGGCIEAEDSSPEAAALREAEEETGLAPEKVEVLGRLPDYPTATGFLISPVVALVHPPLALRPAPGEVAEIFEVPLPFLLNERNHQRHQAVLHGHLRQYWAMSWKHYSIWGATAGILRMLALSLAHKENLR